MKAIKTGGNERMSSLLFQYQRNKTGGKLLVLYIYIKLASPASRKQPHPTEMSEIFFHGNEEIRYPRWKKNIRRALKQHDARDFLEPLFFLNLLLEKARIHRSSNIYHV